MLVVPRARKCRALLADQAWGDAVGNFHRADVAVGALGPRDAALVGGNHGRAAVGSGGDAVDGDAAFAGQDGLRGPAVISQRAQIELLRGYVCCEPVPVNKQLASFDRL